MKTTLRIFFFWVALLMSGMPLLAQVSSPIVQDFQRIDKSRLPGSEIPLLNRTIRPTLPTAPAHVITKPQADPRVRVAAATVETFNYSGSIVTWTVPANVIEITIEAKGAAGASSEGGVIHPYAGGNGAIITGTVTVTPGQQLRILVGLKANGGGGGSFVVTGSNPIQPLVIAGGGGAGGGSPGNTENFDTESKQGQAGNSGGAGGGTGGTNGNGGIIDGEGAGAGGGLYTNGADGYFADGGGKAFVNGGQGGISGGFGGGGTSVRILGSLPGFVGGGGGGYSGGGGGKYDPNKGYGVGGGGGSFNGGTNQTNTTGANSGDGQVTITYESCAPPTPAAPTTANTAICDDDNNGIQRVRLDQTCASGTTPVWYIDGSLASGVSGATVITNTGNANYGRLTYDQPVGTTTYTYACKSANNCLSEQSEGVAVTVSQLAAPTGVSVTVNGTTVNAGQTSVLCDTDTQSPNSLTLAAACSGGTLQWRTKTGAADWTNWNSLPSSQASDGVPVQYQARCNQQPCRPESGIVTITINPKPTVTVTASANVSCNGGSNGSLSVSASGGTPPFTYTLSPGGQSNATGTFAGLSAGTYTVQAQDGNTCTATTSPITVTEPATLTVASTATTNVSCNGGSNGSLSVAASGGTSPFTYTLSPGGQSNATGTFAGLSAGTYTVQVQDGNTCTATTSPIIISQPTAPLTVASTASANVSCNGGSNGSLSVSASGGTPPFTYTLSPGGQSNATGTFAGLSAGTYTVQAQDGNSCTATTSTIIISQPSAVTVAPGPNKSVVFTPTPGSNCTTISAQGSGGTPGTNPAYTYNWTSSNPAEPAFTGQNPLVCPTVTTTYTVIATDANGCPSSSAQVTVFVQDVRCGPGNKNVQICYYGVTQCVSEKIAKNYLKLGATLGACGSSANTRTGYEAEAAGLSLSLKAYPNPVQDEVRVEVLAPVAGTASFEVLDLTGRARQSRTKELVEGLNEVEFRLGSLPAGVYLIRGVDALGQQATVRVSKQ